MREGGGGAERWAGGVAGSERGVQPSPPARSTDKHWAPQVGAAAVPGPSTQGMHAAPSTLQPWGPSPVPSAAALTRAVGIRPRLVQADAIKGALALDDNLLGRRGVVVATGGRREQGTDAARREARRGGKGGAGGVGTASESTYGRTRRARAGAPARLLLARAAAQARGGQGALLAPAPRPPAHRMPPFMYSRQKEQGSCRCTTMKSSRMPCRGARQGRHQQRLIGCHGLIDWLRGTDGSGVRAAGSMASHGSASGRLHGSAAHSRRLLHAQIARLSTQNPARQWG